MAVSYNLMERSEGFSWEKSIKGRKVNESDIVFGLVTVLMGACANGSSPAPGIPEDTLSVAELLDNPVYDTEVRIHGELSLLGELFCPCFELTSGEATVEVWYDLMAENDGTQRPLVDVTGINNGDSVIVTGELKGEGGTHYSKGDFWAKSIETTE